MYQKEPFRVLLVHPGGPFFIKKDLGVWSIPKGEIQEGENPLDVAVREFEEETGQKPKSEDFISLGEIKQKSGKVVKAWAFEETFDLNQFKSNTFKLEWPPKSGKFQTFPEVDKAELFDVETAKKKINPAQVELIDSLLKVIP